MYRKVSQAPGSEFTHGTVVNWQRPHSMLDASRIGRMDAPGLPWGGTTKSLATRERPRSPRRSVAGLVSSTSHWAMLCNMSRPPTAALSGLIFSGPEQGHCRIPQGVPTTYYNSATCFCDIFLPFTATLLCFVLLGWGLPWRQMKRTER